MPALKFLTLLSLFAVLAACKIQIDSSEGGKVVSASGAYDCAKGKSCSIDVVDVFFKEKFTAKPAGGYKFLRWGKRESALCGGGKKACKLSTAGFDAFAPLLAVLESADVYYLAPEFGLKNVAGKASKSRSCGSGDSVAAFNIDTLVTALGRSDYVVEDCRLIPDNNPPVDQTVELTDIALFRVKDPGRSAGEAGDFAFAWQFDSTIDAYPDFSLYLDTDANAATGKSIDGIGADYVLHNGEQCGFKKDLSFQNASAFKWRGGEFVAINSGVSVGQNYWPMPEPFAYYSFAGFPNTSAQDLKLKRAPVAVFRLEKPNQVVVNRRLKCNSYTVLDRSAPFVINNWR